MIIRVFQPRLNFIATRASNRTLHLSLVSYEGASTHIGWSKTHTDGILALLNDREMAKLVMSRDAGGVRVTQLFCDSLLHEPFLKCAT